MFAIGSDSIAQRAGLSSLRIFAQECFVFDDFGHEPHDYFGHGAEFLGALGQQPGVECAALDANTPRKDIACKIQATHRIAQKHLLGNRHEGTPLKYTQSVYFN